jgi:citronellol/citronellal dehydrogenase
LPCCEEADVATLKDKTIFITGASRGIGKAIALRAARDGANIAVIGKTAEPHPRLSGTVYSACEEIEAAGGNALPVILDIRFEDNVKAAMDKTVAHFGGLDVLVNNASAISLTGTTATTMKRYDLMHSVNTRGTFVCSQAAIPHLLQADNPHILNLSPPLNMEAKWFKNHVAYTMAKFGMSMCVLGMAAELAGSGIAVNALWPRTTIDTAAIRNLLGGDTLAKRSRTPAIIADAAWHILTSPSRDRTGNFFIDDDVLESAGITDLSGYAVDPTQELAPDFFI